MTNVRWFGVYQHSIGHGQFTCGIGAPRPDAVARIKATPLLYLIKVKMKDGSIPPSQHFDYQSLSF